jgi:tetratricopeptide (TPR) repeat protein
VKPLLGRDRELATLTTLLDDARSGRGRSALLLGEAGIGKTRLAEAVADLAVARECPVAWGRCPDGEAPAYWAWRQALRALVGGGTDDLFVAGDSAGRAELFASVADAVEAGTAGRPAVVLLEDLHWADAGSLALIRFVMGVLPGLHLLLVLTARDDPAEISEESATALAGLPPSVLRLPLGGLNRQATAAVVKSVVGPDAPPELLSEVQTRTGGNPFFVTEVARLYALRGGDAMDVPRGVQQVLTRRLAHLSQPASEVLAMAAVVGRPDTSMLARMASRTEAEISTLLAEATSAGLLTATDKGYAFAHDLVRETVYDEASPALRARLHRIAAEALESSGRASAADLATHWSNAGEAKQAAPHFLAAGHAAMASMGYEQAVRYFRQALDGSDGDRIDVLTALGEAEVLAGRLTAGRATLAEAAELARAAELPTYVARAVLAMGTGVGGFEVDLADDRQRPALEWAVDRLPNDPSLRAAVLARLSLLLAGRPEHDDRRRALAREAAEVARQAGDARAEASALGAMVEALAGPDHVAARLESSARMAELARRVDDPMLLLLARRMYLVALLETGRLREVDAEIDAYAHVADRLRLPIYSWPVPLWRGMRALMNGDVDTAARLADDVEAVGLRAGSDNAQIMAFTLRMGASMLLGPQPSFVAIAEHAYDTWLGDLPDAYNWAPAAWLANVGATQRARLIVQERLPYRFADMPKDSEWLEMAWMAGEAGRLLGEMDAVQLSYELLQPYADLWVVDGIGGACYGVAALQLGRLAATLGRLEEAKGWLSTALDVHREAGVDLLTRITEEELAKLGQTDAPTRVATSSATFKREGRVWRVTWRGETATVPDSKGMRDLGVLLARPGHEVAALDLVEVASGPSGAQADTGPQLDRRARDQYRQRLADLSEELAEAEANADAGRTAVLSEEREFLIAELTAAVGLGGRARTTGDPAERARKAVTMRVGTAMKAIAEVHPSLARHLRASVSTGRFCSYEPEDPVSWQI